MIKKWIIVSLSIPISFFLFFSCQKNHLKDYPIQPVNFNQVRVLDNFWKPKIDINRDVTIPFGFEMCEQTGRIDNFAIAGRLKEGAFCSTFPFDDSDVYKIIEGASYALSQENNRDLDLYLDSLIYKISEAQQPDGYLQTWRIIDPLKPGEDWWGEKDRWTGIQHGHELYNVGHLYEAAVAHYLATGKRTLLDVALKNADLVTDTFGPGKKIAVPGHEEIEIGLIKLYRVSGNQQYLDLAKFFVDQRGVGTERELFGEYHQDHLPVRDQKYAAGHAVRAVYLYSAMADLAAVTGDKTYIPALESIWKDIVHRKIYITGGIGARRSGESFGDPYELPNETAYAETCAAIANVLWNYRMFLLTGDGKYYDVLERSLYNGLISGVSQTGDRFFYPNPLFSDGVTEFNYGKATRQEWFPCACCPSNISRFLPSISGYVYSKKADTLYVNLYFSNQADISINGDIITIEQKSQFPWDGKVEIKLYTERLKKFVLAIRIPGWSLNHLLPGNLYTTDDGSTEMPTVNINNENISLDIKNGYVFIDRAWDKQDQVILKLPMEILKVSADYRVIENKNKIALQRGPLVYCFEEVDNGKDIEELEITEISKMKVIDGDIFGGVKLIKIENPDKTFTAIPYFLWSNRGANEMTVWASLKK